MSYEHEHAEWGRAIRDMSEVARAATEVDVRWSSGLCGDAEDARCDDAPTWGEGDE